MPKRPDSQETVQLALELLRRIPRHGKVTASELQQSLQQSGIVRDVRSIQRQLEALCKQFDIECDDRSKPYGYRWLPASKGMALPHMSPQESLLLTLAEEHLRNLLPARLMKSMDVFFSQARRNLGNGEQTALEREWPRKVRMVATSQPLLPPRILPEVFEAVSEALYGNRWLNVEYANAAGKHTKAEVMPLGLVQQGPRLYLVCRFKGFDDNRNLALHRIESAAASTLIFQRPKDFDLKQYDEDGQFGFGNGIRVRLSFTIDGNAGAQLRETPLSADQTIKDLGDGSLRVTATVVDSAMLTWWLNSFGEDVWSVRRLRVT